MKYREAYYDAIIIRKEWWNSVQNLNEILTLKKISATVKKLSANMAAGEPIFGVYPSLDGRKPSFPNPTANLVSTKKGHII